MNTSIETLQEFLDKTLQNKLELKILEAGCGSASHFHFKQRIHLTGIDISEKQLQRNTQLHETIVGDIQYYDLQPSSFDIIICWAVLEHLPRPELALLKFVNAVKKDGLIVLELPNLLSLKGLITKYTPLCFHTWYYKYLFGRSDAGKEDVGPFKTYLKHTITPNAIRKFAIKNGLKVVRFETSDLGDMSYWRQKSKMAKLTVKIYNILRTFSKFASFGKLGDSDFIIVIRK